jgi:nucleoside-diphosphate-sugar epimerase
MKNKKILVTGGAGFVGTNLIKKLLNEGHTVISIDNYSTGYETNHIDGCTYISGDITNNKVINSLPTDVDVMFHLAALARIQPSLVNPKNTIENNFNGTLNVLEYAKVNNIQVIYAGSSSMHHGLYGSPYAWSKFGGEELCKLYSSVFDLNTTICRFYNVYGPHQLKTGTYATVIGIFLDQFNNKQPLTITGDGEQRRDFTHVFDIVDALYLCIDKDFRGEFFELGRGVNYSINELANMWGEYPNVHIPARPGEYPFTLCEDKNAYDKLGWQPKRDLEYYIKKEIL